MTANAKYHPGILMFEDAYNIAAKWTIPIITSTRLRNDDILTELGTGFLVNWDGYFLTAAHVVAGYARHRRALGGPQNDDPVHTVISFGSNQAELESLDRDPFADIALGKIKDFKPPSDQTYPTFARWDGMTPAGKSLCTLGHAFHELDVQWDDNAQCFVTPPGAFPIPRFPMDSIVTRGINHSADDENGGQQKRRFFELSSTGLRGQEGGPVFDVDGIIWGLESWTQAHELKGLNIDEKQYLCLALAVHPSSICEYLDKKKVIYNERQ